jgi:hypothetical protein
LIFRLIGRLRQQNEPPPPPKREDNSSMAHLVRLLQQYKEASDWVRRRWSRANRQPTHSGTIGRLAALPAMQWIEALINVSAFAGFIGLATHWPETRQAD